MNQSKTPAAEATRDIDRAIRRCEMDIEQATTDIRNRVEGLLRYAQDTKDALDRDCGSSSFGCLASNIATLAIDIQRAAAIKDQAQRLKDMLNTAKEVLT